MDGSGGEKRQRNDGIKSKSGVTPLSSIRDLSYFAPQLSLFGGGGEVGNNFGVRAKGSARGGGEGGGLSDIYRPCRWINHPFTRLRFLEEGAVAVESAASEAEY